MARPNKYISHVQPKLEAVKGWAREGLSDEQIAHNLGIGVSTLYEYKKRYIEFSECLAQGKAVADYEVENNLKKMTQGYSYWEEIQEVDPTTGEMVITKRVLKHVRPDVTAIKYWLSNRMADKWREKQTLEHEGHVEVNNPYSELTTEELRKLASE